MTDDRIDKTGKPRRAVVGGQVRAVGVALPGLQAIRQARLMTQAELADASGVSRATIANAERGARVGDKIAAQLAKALDTTVEELRKIEGGK